MKVPLTRSEIMSRIRSKRTKPELILHNLLKGRKTRHKMWPGGPGNPDIMIQSRVIFMNGCFFHGCPKHYRSPKTNTKFWDNKIINNRKKQRSSIRLLKKLGYKVIVIWEHELRPSKFNKEKIWIRMTSK